MLTLELPTDTNQISEPTDFEPEDPSKSESEPELQVSNAPAARQADWDLLTDQSQQAELIQADQKQLKLNSGKDRIGDRIAKTGATAAGTTIMVVLAAVAVFLLLQGLPSLWATSSELPFHAENLWSLAGPLLFGSLWASILALLIAIPVGVGAALFITQYAPRFLVGSMSWLLDLLAAIPSVVYGLWGLMVLAPFLAKFYAWLGDHAAWIPFFAGTPSASGRTILTAAIVLAIMILPIMASVCREVFLLVPPLSSEAALALGATKWEMIRMSVLPFSRSGIISAAMLGLGRALGETMAIAMVLSPTPFLISFKLIESSNPNTVAAMIAQTFPEAHGLEVSALIGLGLLLFIITFFVNALARRLATSQVLRVGK